MGLKASAPGVWTFVGGQVREFAPKGLEDSAKGFSPISANLIKASARRMHFRPVGTTDRSLARSAWEE
jgi:hypothetical protein